MLMWIGGVVQAQPDAVVKELVYTCQKEPWRASKSRLRASSALRPRIILVGSCHFDFAGGLRHYGRQRLCKRLQLAASISEQIRISPFEQPCEVLPGDVSWIPS